MAVTLTNESADSKPLSFAIWAAFITICLIWGSSFLATRFAVETLPLFVMAGTRSLIAGAFLFLWRYWLKDPLPPRAECRSAAIVGILLMGVASGCLAWAVQWIDSGIAALISASAPLWIILIDAVRPRGRMPSRWALAGTAVGFGGLVLLLSPGLYTRTSNSGWLAGGIMVVSAMAWAMGSLFSRDARMPRSPIMGTSISLLAAGTGLLAVALVSGELGQLAASAISLKSVLAWAYLAVFGNCIAFISYSWLLRAAPTHFVSMYLYINPIVALFLGHWLGAEELTLRSMVATGIIVGAVALTTIKGREPEPR